MNRSQLFKVFARIAVAALLALSTVGCSSSDRHNEDGQVEKESNTGSEDNAKTGTGRDPDVKIVTDDTRRFAEEGAGEIETVLQNDAMCRDIINGLRLSDFKMQNPTAGEDAAQSVRAINYRHFRESFFEYGFLDDQLISIAYMLARTQASAVKPFDKYTEAFGKPTYTTIPEPFKEAGATRSESWFLRKYDIAITLTILESPGHPLSLHAFYRSISGSDKLQDRAKRQSGSSSQRSSQTETPRGFSGNEWSRIVVKAKQLGLAQSGGDATRLAPALRTMKSIFVEAGIASPSVNQLFNGVTALTGGFHTSSADKVERSLLRSKILAEQTGVPVATPGQLQRLEYSANP